MIGRSSHKHHGLKGLSALLGLLLVGRAAGMDWQQLPPEEFVRRPEATVRIDFDDFDPALMAAAVFHETNRVRQRLGLPAFVHLPKLDDAADLKAAVGVVQKALTHQNPLPLTARPADRVRWVDLPFQLVAENIARQTIYELPVGRISVGVRERDGRSEYYDLDTRQTVEPRTYTGFAETLVRAWMDSPAHRANLVNPGFTSLGCAARTCRSPVEEQEQIYAVQVFLEPK